MGSARQYSGAEAWVVSKVVDAVADLLQKMSVQQLAWNAKHDVDISERIPLRIEVRGIAVLVPFPLKKALDFVRSADALVYDDVRGLVWQRFPGHAAVLLIHAEWYHRNMERLRVKVVQQIEEILPKEARKA